MQGRGRKKIEDGGKRSPHKIYCVCVYDDDAEQYQVMGDNTTPEQELIDQAKALFKEQFGENKDPHVYGPFHLRKGAIVPKNKAQTASVSDISLDDIVIIPGRKATGVINGWNVAVRFIQDKDDLAYVVFKSEVDVSADKKRQNPGIKVVKLDSIENLVEETSNN